jgi:hypothetical protein
VPIYVVGIFEVIGHIFRVFGVCTIPSIPNVPNQEKSGNPAFLAGFSCSQRRVALTEKCRTVISARGCCSSCNYFVLSRFRNRVVRFWRVFGAAQLGYQIFCYSIKKWEKIYQNTPNNQEIYQMTIKYINIFHCKTLKKLPKL